MAERTCNIEGCGRPYHAHGLCGCHYKRLRKDGYLDPAEPVRPHGLSPRELFWPKVEPTLIVPSPYLGPCWAWGASRKREGYGQAWNGSAVVLAHRLAYEFVKGAIPEGLMLDHLCRHKWCVNPAHLEAVTNRENVMRGVLPAKAGARMRNKTHCPQGHPYDVENTYRNPRDNKRYCRTCSRESSRRYYHERVSRWLPVEQAK